LNSMHSEVIEQASEAVLFADANEIIKIWNKKAELVFGYTSEEAIGRPLAIIIPDRFLSRHQDGYKGVIKTGVTAYDGKILSVPAKRKDGSTISIEFSVAIIREQREILGISAIIRDTTEEWKQTNKP
jgi:PAS domain S-box-containing protein